MDLVAFGTAAALAALLVVRELMWRRAFNEVREKAAADRVQSREREQLAQVGQLVSGLAQELKSPLQGVIGNTEPMLASAGSEGTPGTSSARSRRTSRAAGIVGNLLAFTETSSLTAAVTLATRRGEPEGRLVIELDDRAAADLDEPSWSGDLVACRQIVHAHGGSLDVEHPANGGYRFHLELPVTAGGADIQHAT